jgi:hypothetical protein
MMSDGIIRITQHIEDFHLWVDGNETVRQLATIHTGNHHIHQYQVEALLVPKPKQNHRVLDAGHLDYRHKSKLFLPISHLFPQVL